MIYRLLNSGSPPHFFNGRITFELAIPPAGMWHTCCDYVLVQDTQEREPVYGCDYLAGDTALDDLQRQWQRRATGLTSANEDMYRLYRQSIEDMGALRLYDMDFAPDVWLPAAGGPGS